jgi:predicted MFS family arabinose efflux permease
LEPRRTETDDGEIWWREIINIFDRHIVLAAALLFTLHLSLPCISSFVVLYSRQLGVSHFGWYYVAIGVTSTVARPLLGRVSDKIGCGRSLIVAFGLETIALLVMPMVTNLAGIIIGGSLWYLGSAIGGAQILALAMESAPVERRARAMASFSVAFPLSNGVGALFNGFVVDLAGFTWMYLSAALLCAAGLGITAKHWASLQRAMSR